MPTIRRITLFKVPNKEDQKTLIGIYQGMQANALKDGEQYILSVDVGQAQEDQRAQGFTVAAVSSFAGIEDMQYYDTECDAHKKLREFVRTVNQGFCMVYFSV
ncbi:hypothetical protein PVAG01_09890 [Phlyctema vagabunda]|uniref:Stress-response A/B barrel domain-containing protein n=1 Tax=Phlyctema vagabunda TaxID=108571 RepID=A0ABR4P4C5_9HELO